MLDKVFGINFSFPIDDIDLRSPFPADSHNNHDFFWPRTLWHLLPTFRHYHIFRFVVEVRLTIQIVGVNPGLIKNKNIAELPWRKILQKARTAIEALLALLWCEGMGLSFLFSSYSKITRQNPSNTALGCLKSTGKLSMSGGIW